MVCDCINCCSGLAWVPSLQVWRKTVLRKWLNIKSSESDFSADEGDTADEADSESEYEGACIILPAPFPLSPVPSCPLEHMNSFASSAAKVILFTSLNL